MKCQSLALSRPSEKSVLMTWVNNLQNYCILVLHFASPTKWVECTHTRHKQSERELKDAHTLDVIYTHIQLPTHQLRSIVDSHDEWNACTPNQTHKHIHIHRHTMPPPPPWRNSWISGWIHWDLKAWKWWHLFEQSCWATSSQVPSVLIGCLSHSTKNSLDRL